MAINTKRVVLGGLAAGVLMIIVNILGQIALGARVVREMNAWMPGAADRITGGTGTIVVRVITTFLLGIILVWLYAAVRPRFGPGLRTAALVAVVVWVISSVFHLDYLLTGMLTGTTWWLFAVFQLVNLLIATWVGARLYSEESVSVA
jgi:hypothetical protein